MWGRGLRGNSGACSTLYHLSVTSPTSHKQSGPFWCWFPCGWVCVHSRTLWVSPANSPVSLGVSPTAASSPTGVFSWRFEALFLPRWNPGLQGLSYSPVVPPGLSAFKCGSSRHCLAVSPLHPTAHLCPSYWSGWMFLLLTPCLSDFHAVWFSVSSGGFLFLNCCCPSFVCAWRQKVSTYTSILAGSPPKHFLSHFRNISFLST